MPQDDVGQSLRWLHPGLGIDSLSSEVGRAPWVPDHLKDDFAVRPSVHDEFSVDLEKMLLERLGGRLAGGRHGESEDLRRNETDQDLNERLAFPGRFSGTGQRA